VARKGPTPKCRGRSHELNAARPTQVRSHHLWKRRTVPGEASDSDETRLLNLSGRQSCLVCLPDLLGGQRHGDGEWRHEHDSTTILRGPTDAVPSASSKPTANRTARQLMVSLNTLRTRTKNIPDVYRAEPVGSSWQVRRLAISVGAVRHGVTRPTELPPPLVNHRAPSGPAVIPSWPTMPGSVYSEKLPAVVTRPIAS
jgi:hypothetical protein